MMKSAQLKELIIKEISEKGEIPFSRFMELCLYQLGLGYYRKDYLPIGKAGDFYTSPCVHSIFGHTIGKQFIEFINAFGEEDIYLIEAGAGRGHLARDIGEYLKKNNYNLKLIIIEPHKPFRDMQYKEVKDFYKEVIFFNEPSELDEVSAIFYSNELFDSFPVEILENIEGEINQVYVTVENNLFKEVLRPASESIKNFIFTNNINVPEGFRTEISPSSLEFYSELLKKIRRGFSLIIDYGYTQEEFFESHRRKGTLMCYKNHLVDENPYELVGEKDLTAHVNFSLFSKAGEALGFKTIGFTEQQYFLMGAGILEEIEAIKNSLSQEDYENEIRKIKNLIIHSMGYVFKFLCQKKDIEKEAFKGFSLRDFRKGL